MACKALDAAFAAAYTQGMKNTPSFLSITLPWPAPARGNAPVRPVFIPFSGCPTRCIFCAQHVQTGQGQRSLASILAAVRDDLRQRRARQAPAVELAFFGGTFTAMPAADQQACLDVAKQGFDEGTVCALRCSTRPDCLSAQAVHRLMAAGCTMIELGVQSFHDSALVTARRGYSGAVAQEACATVLAAGCALGVQLMPGMPGVTAAIFLQDVHKALTCGAHVLRYYPCLVLRGTVLEDLYRQGAYAPWTWQETLAALTQGWLMARQAKVPVIRMGLAPEEGLDAAVLAGPQHKALGAEVQAQALLHTVEQACRGQKLQALIVPRFCQGFFWGEKRRLAAAWAGLGLSSQQLHWHAQPELVLHCAPE